MLSLYLIAAIFILLPLACWLTSGNPGRHRNGWRNLRQVDLAAFQNLLSRNDDGFLRGSLTSQHYREVRRARVRAIQQYLAWIAENCAIVLAQLLFGRADREARTAPDAKTLALIAIQLRIVALGIWLLLWFEYVFPNSEIRPAQLMQRYESLLRGAESSLNPRVPHTPSRSG